MLGWADVVALRREAICSGASNPHRATSVRVFSHTLTSFIPEYLFTEARLARQAGRRPALALYALDPSREPTLGCPWRI